MDFALATSQFRGSQNLGLSGFYVWNNNPLGTGKSKAYGMRFNYPNDVWRARASFRELQENYDPALGFTRRENFRRRIGRIAWSSSEIRRSSKQRVEGVRPIGPPLTAIVDSNSLLALVGCHLPASDRSETGF